MRECVRMLAANLAIAVPIAVATPFVMVLVINVFFDGLYALDPVTSRIGPELTLILYALAWVAVVGLIVWMVRRRLRAN